LAYLKSNEMRITPARRLFLQFVLDHKSERVSLKEIHRFMDAKMTGVNRSSIYRNIETFKKLNIIQELNLPSVGKRFQYVFDRKVHHFYICKSCGKANQGTPELFRRIEKALKDVHGFSKANLSVIFYGRCARCSRE